ncbi:MAG: Gfo/Idh/MocA family protein [Acidobacteriota bacterium]
MRKVKWGVLGAAKIAIQKVIPAMQDGTRSEIVALASRDPARARSAADSLGIARAYGSYEELLRDPEIEAVYNPLPNHLHVPWSIKAAQAGKHVLCEKPIALSVKEARELIQARERTGRKIQEAFMVRSHPQWLATLELIQSGRIGSLQSIQGFFSYNNPDPANIRNIAEYGGGALMDIGCYPITISRMVFGQEPHRVSATMELDRDLKVDRLTTAILEFPAGQSAFTCATQLVPYQRMHVFGSSGRIEVQIPFNAPPDRPCRIFVDGGELFGTQIESRDFDVCNQYTIQGDLFSQAIQEGGPVAVPLEDSLRNMAVIEAIVRSAGSGRWEKPVTADPPDAPA